jgi:hypothetical protein
MKKLIVPKFPTEAEEAAWWDNPMDVVEENLVEAIQGGTAGRGTAPRVLQEVRELEGVTIQLPRSDCQPRRAVVGQEGPEF